MRDLRKPCINKDFTAEEFEDEILLYSLSDSTAVYLNNTAHLVWQLCGTDRTVDEIIGLLKETYPDHQEQIDHDVSVALRSLASIGAISFET